ncbi:MAG: hypothetical protein WCK38_01620, partial [Candidatus Omnitrophota bacterium]
MPASDVSKAGYAKSKDGTTYELVKRYALLRGVGDNKIVADNGFFGKDTRGFAFYHVDADGNAKPLDIARWSNASHFDYMYGMGWLSYGHFDLALKSFNRALVLNPDNKDASDAKKKCEKLERGSDDSRQKLVIDVLNSVEGLAGRECINQAFTAYNGYVTIKESLKKYETAKALNDAIDTGRARLQLVAKHKELNQDDIKNIMALIPELNSIPNFYRGSQKWSDTSVSMMVNPNDGTFVYEVKTSTGEGQSVNVSSQFDATRLWNAITKYLDMDAREAVLNITLNLKSTYTTDGESGTKSGILSKPTFGLTLDYGIMPAEFKGDVVAGVQTAFWPETDFENVPLYTPPPEELKLSVLATAGAYLEGAAKQAVYLLVPDPQTAAYTRLGLDFATGWPMKLYEQNKLGQIPKSSRKMNDPYVAVDKDNPTYISVTNAVTTALEGRVITTDQVVSHKDLPVLKDGYDLWDNKKFTESSQDVKLAVLEDVFQSIVGRGIKPAESTKLAAQFAAGKITNPQQLAWYLINLKDSKGDSIVDTLGASKGREKILSSVWYRDNYRTLVKHVAVDNSAENEKDRYYVIYQRVFDEGGNDIGTLATTFFKDGLRKMSTFAMNDHTVYVKRDANEAENKKGVKTVVEMFVRTDRTTPQYRAWWKETLRNVYKPTHWPVVGWGFRQGLSGAEWAWDAVTPAKEKEASWEKVIIYETINPETLKSEAFIGERQLVKKITKPTDDGPITYFKPVRTEQRVKTADGRYELAYLNTDYTEPGADGKGTFKETGKRLGRNGQLENFEKTGSYIRVPIGKDEDGIPEYAIFIDEQTYLDPVGMKDYIAERVDRGLKNLLNNGERRIGFLDPANDSVQWEPTDVVVRTARFTDNASGRSPVSIDYSIRDEDKYGALNKMKITFVTSPVPDSEGYVDISVTVGNAERATAKFKGKAVETGPKNPAVNFKEMNLLETYEYKKLNGIIGSDDLKLPNGKSIAGAGNEVVIVRRQNKDKSVSEAYVVQDSGGNKLAIFSEGVENGVPVVYVGYAPSLGGQKDAKNDILTTETYKGKIDPKTITIEAALLILVHFTIRMVRRPSPTTPAARTQAPWKT